MFRKQKQREEAAAEAARDAERRALFEKLAQRPETVCPFLGLAEDRVGFEPGATDEHRCYAFGDPAPLSFEQQTRVCLQRGYGNCPRYLRGILVIPTEELEALRHPQPMPMQPAPVEAPPPRRRGALVAAALALLLVLGGGAAAFLLTRGGNGVAVGSPTQQPIATPSETASATPSIAPTSTATGSSVPTPTPEPTPTAGDVFDHYEVQVAPGDYTIYRLDAAGNVVGRRPASFDNYSFGIVSLVDSPVRSWLYEAGDYAGFSFVANRSGPFRIRKVYLSPAGERRVEYLPDDQL